jgi:hypothetical protein
MFINLSRGLLCGGFLSRHFSADLPTVWHQTTLGVRLLVLGLCKCLEVLEARLHQHSSNSSQRAASARRHTRPSRASLARGGGRDKRPALPCLAYPGARGPSRRWVGERLPRQSCLTTMPLGQGLAPPRSTTLLSHPGGCTVRGTGCG